MRFTDEAELFLSEASVYRLLKAHDLITSPAYIVIKAAEEFEDDYHGAQPALADPIHLSQDHELGLVLFSPCWTTSRASLSPGSSVRP